jgi:tripartite-type tricarboxylate transporter receptor subunit TctC
MKKFTRILSSLLLSGFTLVAGAQGYPLKPIRIIEPAGPGSAVDLFARKLSPVLTERLGQPVLVDNRPGANSAIGAREAAKSAPDGYTLFHANINNSLNDILSGDACCKLNEALIPVTKLTGTPLVMVVNPALGVKTWKDYLVLAKSQPLRLTFASGGTGSITQLLGLKVNMASGLSIQEVPYKAIGAELPDLLAGHVVTAYLAPVVVAQYIHSGKLIALAVAGSRRIPVLPDVPTLAEAGLPDVEAAGWNGLFVPAGTPKAIIQKLNTEIAAIMASPAFRQDAYSLGYELGSEGPDEFGAYVKTELVKWGKVIREGKIKVE